jgi:hypothetical protein
MAPPDRMLCELMRDMEYPCATRFACMALMWIAPQISLEVMHCIRTRSSIKDLIGVVSGRIRSAWMRIAVDLTGFRLALWDDVWCNTVFLNKYSCERLGQSRIGYVWVWRSLKGTRLANWRSGGSGGGGA